MNRNGRVLFAGVIALLFLFSAQQAIAAPDGKALFQANCATCHNPLKDATGPALQGARNNWPSPEWVYDWVHNPSGMIASGDKHANELFNKYKPTVMTAFPALAKEDIDAIFKYVDEYKAPTVGGTNPNPGAASAEDDTWLYSLITIVLLVLAIILWRVNAGLKRVAQAKEGQPVEKEIPIYRHKFWIAAAIILLICFAGYWMVNGALNGPPAKLSAEAADLLFSHKVHAGINQINCLYCHAGAEKSRHAMIPSTNVCMNCHKQISRIHRREGA